MYEDIIELHTIVVAKRKKLASAPGHDVLDHINSSSSGPSPLSNNLLSASAKACFDEWFNKILVDSYAKESRINAHIDVVAREAKEREDKIREEAKLNEENIMASSLFWKVS